MPEPRSDRLDEDHRRAVVDPVDDLDAVDECAVHQQAQAVEPVERVTAPAGVSFQPIPDLTQGIDPLREHPASPRRLGECLQPPNPDLVPTDRVPRAQVTRHRGPPASVPSPRPRPGTAPGSAWPPASPPRTPRTPVPQPGEFARATGHPPGPVPVPPGVWRSPAPGL